STLCYHCVVLSPPKVRYQGLSLFPYPTLFRSIIDGGEIGHIYAARVDAIRRRGIPGWGVFTNKELQGGGPVIDIGVHMLDTCLRSEEHTSELQSRENLVCRHLLEKIEGLSLIR